MKAQPGKLILLPNVLEESLPADPFLPASVQAAVSELDGLIAESEKSARRYLRRFLSHEKMTALPLRLLNEHTPLTELDELLKPILDGKTWGLISDAGLPCVADPGADLVAACTPLWRQCRSDRGALFFDPRFATLGIFGTAVLFPRVSAEAADLEKTVKDLEKKAKGETQIWIEAPYRSAKMLEALKLWLQPATRLCVSLSLTTPSQRVASHSIQQWKSFLFEIGKEPAVFLIHCSK